LSLERLVNVTATPEELLVRAPSRKDKARVQFGALIEQRLLKIGSELYTKDKKHKAVIQADGSLRYADGFVGSIHTLAKHLYKKQACNGWDIWLFSDGKGSFSSIDTLREAVRSA